jgi:hypothetical protein
MPAIVAVLSGFLQKIHLFLATLWDVLLFYHACTQIIMMHFC